MLDRAAARIRAEVNGSLFARLHVLCDVRMLLDSGRDCPRCGDRQASSRAQRHAVAAAVDTAMPGASEAERRTAAEQQLHESVTARAWAKAREWFGHAGAHLMTASAKDGVRRAVLTGVQSRTDPEG
ncbi:hypothetical protein OG604_48175 [Streptomyces sp. NBC_01231]|nr:hypothetical protein OG604_48175 [Streptomyces sp. NBC_01231]